MGRTYAQRERCQQTIKSLYSRESLSTVRFCVLVIRRVLDSCTLSTSSATLPATTDTWHIAQYNKKRERMRRRRSSHPHLIGNAMPCDYSVAVKLPIKWLVPFKHAIIPLWLITAWGIHYFDTDTRRMKGTQSNYIETFNHLLLSSEGGVRFPLLRRTTIYLSLHLLIQVQSSVRYFLETFFHQIWYPSLFHSKVVSSRTEFLRSSVHSCCCDLQLIWFYHRHQKPHFQVDPNSN